MKYSKKYVYYNSLRFQIFKNVYEPAEDTFLIADNMTLNEKDNVLDLGTGCGILAILAAQKAKSVLAVDVNPYAVRCAKRNAETNGVAEKVDVRRGDLFQPIHNDEKFSLIVFNAPYLPSEPEEARSWLGKSWAGGPTGRRLIDRFVMEAPRHLNEGGRILLVQSSLAGVGDTLENFRTMGLEAEVVAQEKAAFETIALIQAKPYI